jgi:hypothetical protein
MLKDLLSNFVAFFGSKPTHFHTTYPKFSLRSHRDFELQQKFFKPILNFNSKIINQKYGHTLQQL